ncbi:hypothetical protein BRC93_11175 [Halobacteriales archaeon QS_5_70_15]|nr:MAG: hypothetical protein BRC93_11175 [Halobacteriales archaeon QS_5_70_15]
MPRSSRPSIRSALVATPTLGPVGIDRFLAVGAAVGGVGWGVTVLRTAVPGLVADPELVAMVVWIGLVGVVVGVGTLATPDAVRFSRPLLAWGGANATATLLSTLSLVGVLPRPSTCTPGRSRGSPATPPPPGRSADGTVGTPGSTRPRPSSGRGRSVSHWRAGRRCSLSRSWASVTRSLSR